MPEVAGHHIFYDGTCPLCRASKSWLQGIDGAAARFTFVDSRDPVAMARFPGVGRAETEGQLFVVTPDGRSAGGYDGLLLLLPPGHPLGPSLSVPRVRSLGRRVYGWVARNRHRLFGADPGCGRGTGGGGSAGGGVCRA